MTPGGRVAVAGVIAVAGGVGLATLAPAVDGSVDWLRARVGPDYVHSAAERRAAAVCVVGSPEYSPDRCEVYTMAGAAKGLARFPAAEGGTCGLASRFECARAAGLEQWDQDVPLARPWDLHNGLAGVGFSAGAGAVLGLVVGGAGLVAARSGQRSGQVRTYRWTGAGLLARTAAAGAVAGVVLMDAGRHTLAEVVPFAGPWLATSAALAGVLVWGFRWRAGRQAAVTTLPAPEPVELVEGPAPADEVAAGGPR